MGIMPGYQAKIMKDFLKGFGVVILAGAMLASIFWASPLLMPLIQKIGAQQTESQGETAPATPQKTTAELVADAHTRSQNIKALYMTAEVANDTGAGATHLRNHIIALADSTEINAIVIDTKEVCGPEYNADNLKKLINELHQKNIWAIARIVAFKDASQREVHPEWYLTRDRIKPADESACARKSYLTAKNPSGAIAHPPLWRDNKGGYWMDPASDGARDYILRFGESMSDMGFDELQFDYVRFPSDGDVSSARYPAWDKKTPKYEVMKSFFAFLNKNLKERRPELILSADLFGYVASQGEEESIGQRVADIGSSFDYISFMVYPSHYYAGLVLPADARQGLPAVNYTLAEARTHPDIVVGRSIRMALDFLNPAHASSSATSAQDETGDASQQNAAIRPWLEDFFHEQDRLAGRPAGNIKVRMQIDAAEQSGKHGWLLWNASNIYSEGALKKE